MIRCFMGGATMGAGDIIPNLPTVGKTGGVNACNKKCILHTYSMTYFTF